jgi:hypothetical protein
MIQDCSNTFWISVHQEEIHDPSRCVKEDTMIETPRLTVEESARRDAFVRRLFQATVEGGNLVTIYLGNRLGLYQAKLGSLTPSELATQAGAHERYMRERLKQQAVAGIIEVEDAVLATCAVARTMRSPMPSASIRGRF